MNSAYFIPECYLMYTICVVLMSLLIDRHDLIGTIHSAVNGEHVDVSRDFVISLNVCCCH